jgi:hypothetical protein
MGKAIGRILMMRYDCKTSDLKLKIKITIANLHASLVNFFVKKR